MHLRIVVAIALLLDRGANHVDAQGIQGHASPGNYIIHEEYSSALSHGGSMSVSSNVPVTIQQYNDDEFMWGEQPLDSNEATVLVTSDCDATTYIPQVNWGTDSIDVTVQGVLGADTLPFLTSSSYNASWSYTSYWCEALKHTYPPTPAPQEESERIKGGGAFSLKSALRRILGKSAREAAGQAEEEDRVLSENVCTVNVEVMIYACEHSVNVTAPKIRVKEGTPVNVQSSPDPEDECVTNYEADIVFPGPPKTEGEDFLEVPSLADEGDDDWSSVCTRAIEGRPFVDATGRTLQASSFVAPTIVGEVKIQGWSVDEDNAQLQEEARPLDNSTVHQNQLALGEKWTKSALGEHASVASFAAFSIALMTNGAPSNLVEDALVAALDEVRHAKTSFDIASRLTGMEVGPGPLPESKHEFGHDLQALALAVAKEGCIDETLSALEAAAEVDVLDAVLANGAVDGSKYFGVERTTLTWMRDELRTIALEESGHAALAWRTFEWVCGVDSEVCDAVKREVLSEDKLEGAFRRRFGALDGITMDSWRKIYSRDDAFDAQVCISGSGEGGETQDGSLVSFVAENAINGILCG